MAFTITTNGLRDCLGLDNVVERLKDLFQHDAVSSIETNYGKVVVTKTAQTYTNDVYILCPLLYMSVL